MAVVKADAYGHGATTVAQTALQAGATWLGVATIPEELSCEKQALTHRFLSWGPITCLSKFGRSLVGNCNRPFALHAKP